MMSKTLVRPGPWLLLAALLLACSRAGLVPRATAGLAAGTVIGAAYLWLLLRRTSSLPRLPPQRAVAAAQFAAVLRFCFVFAAFGAVAKAWPQAALAWGASAFLVPLVVSMIAMARGA